LQEFDGEYGKRYFVWKGKSPNASGLQVHLGFFTLKNLCNIPVL